MGTMTIMGKAGAGKALQASDILPKIRSILSLSDRRGSSVITNQGKAKTTLGVCVSGGPDSMALAYLLRSLTPLVGAQVVPLAMIVDHKARTNSTEEARWVQNELQKIDVESMILTLQWGKTQKPSALPDFESEARKLRYRAVTKAAIGRHIRHIFTGHHQGDQYETVLMRLIHQQHKDLSGLCGIAASSVVPCCDDLHGVHEGNASWRSSQTLPRHFNSSTGHTKSNHFDLWLPNDRAHTFFTPQGMQLHRPLLEFSKADLIATCNENNIGYVTDPTNADPQVTTRNAIRHLYTNSKLPLALQTSRVLSLQAHARNSIKQVEAHGHNLLQSFNVRKLFLNSGVVEIQFPFSHGFAWQEIRALSNAVSLLIELVTPTERSSMPLQAPFYVLARLFPEAVDEYLPDGEEPLDYSQTSPFSYRGVLFTPHADQKNVWTLSRQPMRSAELARNTWNFQPIESGRKPNPAKTKWKLWDNRFWISLEGKSAYAVEGIQICPLTTERLAGLRARLKERDNQSGTNILRDLDRLLHTVAPGRVRHTLPVLVFEGEVIRFPTLPHPKVDVDLANTCTKLGLTTSVRYKNADYIRHLKMTASTDYCGSRHQAPEQLLDILGLKRGLQKSYNMM